MGGGPARIAFPEVVAYANEYRIFDEDQRDQLVYYIAEMDETFIGHVMKVDDDPDWKRDTKTKS